MLATLDAAPECEFTGIPPGEYLVTLERKTKRGLEVLDKVEVTVALEAPSAVELVDRDPGRGEVEVRFWPETLDALGEHATLAPMSLEARCVDGEQKTERHGGIVRVVTVHPGETTVLTCACRSRANGK